MRLSARQSALEASPVHSVTGKLAGATFLSSRSAASTNVLRLEVTGRMIAGVVHEFRGKNGPSFGGTTPKTEGFPQLNRFIFNFL